MGFYELAERLSRAPFFRDNDSRVTSPPRWASPPSPSLAPPATPNGSPITPAVQILRPPEPPQADLDTLEESLVLSESLAELRKL